MKDTNVVDVRNFMLAGHSGSGKTTLVDTLLFTLGVVALLFHFLRP